MGFSFDPSSEPGFRGKLAVQITGYLTGGEVAFRTQVNLDLRDGFGDEVN